MTLDLITLIVDDYDRAATFLTAGLGFLVETDERATTNDGRQKRWLVVRPSGGGTGLLLARADGLDQTAAVGRQFAGRVGLFLQVADVDAAVDRAVAAGAEVARPARDEPYGRVAVIADPWGNKWDLVTHRSPSESSASGGV